MSIVLVGINHKSAPVEVRERLAFTEDACATGLRTLVDGNVVREGLIVSTCNRVEVLAETASDRLNDTIERVNQFLSRTDSLPRSLFETHLYQHTDDEAVRHLFRVTSSLAERLTGHLFGNQILIGCRRTNYDVCLRDVGGELLKVNCFPTKFTGQAFRALFSSVREQHTRDSGVEQVTCGKFGHLARADQERRASL